MDLHGNSFVIHGMIWGCLRPDQTKGMEIPKMMPQQTQVPGPNETRIDLRGKLLSSKRRFWSLYIPVFAVEMNPSESTKLILPIDLFLTFRTKLKHQKTPCSWVHPRLLRLNGEPPTETTASWRSFPMPLMLLRQMANLFGWADGPIGPMAKCYVDHPIYRCNVS